MHGSKERERESECVPLNVCVRDCDHITCVNMRGDSVSICACARARVCVCVCVCAETDNSLCFSLEKRWRGKDAGFGIEREAGSNLDFTSHCSPGLLDSVPCPRDERKP